MAYGRLVVEWGSSSGDGEGLRKRSKENQNGCARRIDEGVSPAL